MDRTLKALLDADDRLDAVVPGDRVDVLETLCQELPRLLDLTRQEWDAKLAHIRDDVDDLSRQAERAAVTAARLARQHEHALRGLQTLEAFAARQHDPSGDDGDGRDQDRDDARMQPADLSGEAYARAILQADSTRDVVLLVMGQAPDRSWAPHAVHDESRRLGRTTSRTSIQTFMQRAVGTDVRKVGTGLYQLMPQAASANREPSPGPKSRVREADVEEDENETWLTPEVLDRVADEAQSLYLAQHAGEADPDQLIAEAKRRVAGWIDRHNQDPYDEAHLRRLVKTAMDDWCRRRRRNGSKPSPHAEAAEVTA